MKINVLRASFREQLHKLDRFFHKKLSQEPRTQRFLEIHKRDLLGNLFEELVKTCNRGSYENYDPDKLIFIKANKVWIDFIRALDRESKKKAAVDIESLPLNFSTVSFRQEIESKNTVALIQAFLDPEDFELLMYRAEGHSYRQILKLTHFPSENAAKTRHYRVLNLVRKKFGYRKL